MQIHSRSSKRALTASASKKPQAAKGKTPAKKPKNLWDTTYDGFKKVVRQGDNAASVALNLRIGSKQLNSLLGDGIASSMGAAGMYVGFAAAGLKVGDGLHKLYLSGKTKKVSTGIDGVKDLGSAALTGLASAGMLAARMVVLPGYAAFNTFRGLYTIGWGMKEKNKKRQFLGLRRTVSSAGLLARSLKRYSPVLKTAGIALAPVAGALQAGQGVHSLVNGLKENNNRKELKGLVDIASAAGLTMLLTGVAGIPGMAIFGTANFVYSAYTMSKTVQKVVDPVIDRAEPAARKGVEAVAGLGKPLSKAWEAVKDFFQDDIASRVDDFYSVMTTQNEEGLIVALNDLDESILVADDSLHNEEPDEDWEIA